MTRCGVLLPTFDPLRTGGAPAVVEAARLAEALGFDSVWAGDHLVCPAPVLDAPSALAAAAAVTERVSVGLSVMLLALRPPAWAAKQIATLQALSANRLKLGVGVGGEFPEEFAAAGVPVEERAARLNQALAGLPDLLGGRAVQLDGPTPRLSVPQIEPVAEMPPILVGGRSQAALRRAARFGDFWLPMWLSPQAVARGAEQLAEFASALGRPRPALAMLIGVRVDEDSGRAQREAAAHLQGQYRLPLDRVVRWTALGDPDAVGGFLQAYREVGVEEFVLMPLGGHPLHQIERLSELITGLRSSPQSTRIADEGAAV